MNNYTYVLIRKVIFLLAMCSISISSIASEQGNPDFTQMKAIDHANRIFSNGSKNFLVIFKNYYKKIASTYIEVPKLLPGYHYVSHQCALDDSQDEKITAYVKIDPNQEKWKDVRYAWLVDLSNSSIKILEPSRVFCFNDAWGI